MVMVFVFWNTLFLAHELTICLAVAESQLAVRFQPVFSASSFHCASSYVFKQPAVLTVKITSHLVNPVNVDCVAVSLTAAPAAAADQFEVVSHSQLERQTSSSSEQSQLSGGSATSANILDLYSRVRSVVRQSSQPLDLVEYVELEADRITVSACGVMCQAAMRPSPSTPVPSRERVITRHGDWDLAFTTTNCVLQPGDNVVQLTARASCLLLVDNYTIQIAVKQYGDTTVSQKCHYFALL